MYSLGDEKSARNESFGRVDERKAFLYAFRRDLNHDKKLLGRNRRGEEMLISWFPF